MGFVELCASGGMLDGPQFNLPPSLIQHNVARNVCSLVHVSKPAAAAATANGGVISMSRSLQGVLGTTPHL
jgi:hypothetical protein